MIFQTFYNGINLGGWLSQYEYLASQPLTDMNLKTHFDSSQKRTSGRLPRGDSTT